MTPDVVTPNVATPDVATPDIAILGGGAAGQAAAAEARARGASVVILDEPWPGGLTTWAMPAPGAVRVWGLWREGAMFRLTGGSMDGPVEVTARALIVCAGAADTPDGPVPAMEATGVLWADHGFDPTRGGWVPVVDGHQRTTVSFLYAAGRCADLNGDPEAAGRRAGAAAVADLTGTTGWPVVTQAAAMPATAVSVPPPDAMICPCEGVTRADLDAAIAAGARDVNQAKSFTRAGMGACQGRLCGHAVGTVIGRAVGGRAAAGFFTPRLPLRPIPMAAVLGRFDYADIPVPKAAPI